MARVERVVEWVFRAMLIAGVAYALLVPVAVVCGGGRTHHLRGPWSIFESPTRMGCVWIDSHSAVAVRSPEGIRVFLGAEDEHAYRRAIEDNSNSYDLAHLGWNVRSDTRGWFIADHRTTRQVFTIDGGRFTDEDVREIRRQYAAAIDRVYTPVRPWLDRQALAELPVADSIRTVAVRGGMIFNTGAVVASLALATPLVVVVPGRVAAARRRWALEAARASRRCGSCGYDVSATPERCPECGEWLTVDGAELAEYEPRA